MPLSLSHNDDSLLHATQLSFNWQQRLLNRCRWLQNGYNTNCNVSGHPLLAREARASRITSSLELAASWHECMLCMRWSVDMLPETIRTLWREISSITSLRAVRTAFSSAWNDDDDEHHLPARIVHSRVSWGPVETMMPLSLPCVAAHSR